MLPKPHRQSKLRGLIIVNLALEDLDNFKNRNEEMEKRLDMRQRPPSHLQSAHNKDLCCPVPCQIISHCCQQIKKYLLNQHMCRKCSEEPISGVSFSIQVQRIKMCKSFLHYPTMISQRAGDLYTVTD